MTCRVLLFVFCVIIVNRLSVRAYIVCYSIRSRFVIAILGQFSCIQCIVLHCSAGEGFEENRIVVVSFAAR